MSSFVKVGTKGDFPENQTTGVKVGDEAVCIANTEGELTAFEDNCTHAAALLSGCPIEDGQVTCPLHGAKFDMKSGAAMTLPATEPAKMYQVKLEGDDVLVSIEV